MTDDGSLSRYARELHASDLALREEAARRIWDHFASRLRGIVRRRLDPRMLRKVGESDVLAGVFADFFAAKPGPNGPPQSHDDLWRLLVHFTLCKVASTANRLSAIKVGLDREQPLEDFDCANPSALGPEDEAIAREEFERLLALLPVDLRHVLSLRLEGYTNAEIAARLGRVERTVELRLRAIRSLLAPHLRVDWEE